MAAQNGQDAKNEADNFDFDFTFEMQDHNSFEKLESSDQKQSNEDNYLSSCRSDFGINFEDLVKEQNESLELAKNDLEESKESGPKSKSKQVRWRKQDDKTLFRELTQMLRSHSLTIEQFITIGKTGINHSIVENLIMKVNWKGTNAAFIERICKLNKKEKYLSYRDFKNLRKMYYEQLRNHQVDWDFLLFEFPGRNLDYIKEVCYSFPRRESILEKSSSHSN